MSRYLWRHLDEDKRAVRRIDATEGVHEVLYDIRLYGAETSLTDNYDAISAAATNAAIAGGTLYIPPGTWLIDTELEIPANVPVRFGSGAVISNTKDLTFCGTVEAGRYEIFDLDAVGNVYLRGNTEVYPEWFGASTSATNNAPAFQRAIDAAHLFADDQGAIIILVGPGSWQTQAPIYLYSYVTLRGVGRGRSIIQKTTNTAGTRGTVGYGAETDDYDVDAIISLWHTEDEECQWCQIEDVHLYSTLSPAPDYGIFAPRTGYCTFRNVRVVAVTGVLMRTNSLCLMDHVLTFTNGDGSTGYGFNIDSSAGNWSTSLTMRNCYVQYARYGYYIRAQQYSSLVACACDYTGDSVSDTHGWAYYFHTCHAMSLSGCGCEFTYGTTLRVEGGHVTATGFFAGDVYATTDVTRGIVEVGYSVSDGRLVVIGARWATAAGGRAGYNSAVQSSSSLTYINTQTPAGAALGDLVSGSTLDTFTDGDLHVDDDLDIDGDAAVNGDLTVIGEGNITGGITSGGDMNPNTGDILARITSTARAYRIMGEKLTGISEDTFFDILTFTATSAIGTSYFGVLSGFLTVIVRQRNTDGLARWRAETFKLSVGPTSGVSALTSALTSLDSDSVGTVNLTVQQKAGATTTSLTIEAKFSIEVGKWGAVPACMWWLEVMSQGYNTSNYLIVPAVV